MSFWGLPVWSSFSFDDLKKHTHVSLQLAFIGHDVGHHSVHATHWANNVLGIFTTSFLGIGVSHWVDNHNAHHSVVNSSDCDPEVQVSGVIGPLCLKG